MAQPRVLTVLAIIVLLASLAGWLYLKSRMSAVPYDAESLCATDRAPSEVLVIVLDVSDQFSEAQLLQVLAHLTRERDRTPKLGLIEVYTVERLARGVSE